MTRIDIETRIREKIDGKIARLQSKLDALMNEGNMHDLLEQVKQQIAEKEEELQRLEGMDIADEVAITRLEAARDRLIGKQERLELKLELMQEKRDRYQEAIEGLRETYRETVRETMTSRGAPQRAPGFTSPTASSSRMQDEQRKILEMIQSGKITADEAARLLDALRTKDMQAQQQNRKPRWVRIRVTDTNEDRVRVNLTLPIGLVRAGLRAGGSIAGVEGLDTAGLEDMLNRGEVGHLLNIEDDDDGERVEIFVE